MRRSLVIGLLVITTGCEARIGDGNGAGNGADASPNGDGALVIDAPETDAPACFNGRVVYLNFEGQALTDAPTSDATLNRTSWMIQANGTAPPYKQGNANRAALIQGVIDGVTAQLSSFPIIVVTQRPAQGPYVMIVYGGTAGQVGSRFSQAVNELDCGDVQRSDVAWIADAVTPNQRVVNYTIGAIGFGLGLTATNNQNDCMCGWDNACNQDFSQPCTLSPMINRDPNANQLCPGLTTQNEPATFDAAFCQ